MIGRKASKLKPDFPKAVTAPKGAPNVLLILTDDTGFGAASTFGGPIPTPILDRVAARGLQHRTNGLYILPRHGSLTWRSWGPMDLDEAAKHYGWPTVNGCSA